MLAILESSYNLSFYLPRYLPRLPNVYHDDIDLALFDRCSQQNNRNLLPPFALLPLIIDNDAFKKCSVKIPLSVEEREGCTLKKEGASGKNEGEFLPRRRFCHRIIHGPTCRQLDIGEFEETILGR